MSRKSEKVARGRTGCRLRRSRPLLADGAGVAGASLLALVIATAMDQYFLNDRPISEADASTAWFDYAERNGIDVARAISLWEDASTPEGEASRQTVAQAGIRVEVDRSRHG